MIIYATSINKAPISPFINGSLDSSQWVIIKTKLANGINKYSSPQTTDS